jgi:peptide/nickel transport system permease protein
MTGRPVLEDVTARLPATLELALVSFAIMVAVGIPLGIVSATRKDTIVDHISRLLSISGISIPIFWLGLILIYTLYFTLGWFPSPSGRLDTTLAPPQAITGMFILDSIITGNQATLWSSLRHIALPAITLGIINLAPIARMLRSEMLDILSSNYILAERVSGLPKNQVHRDALRNGMIPILTTLGICFGFLIADVIIIEKLFAWPGIGMFALQSMASNDADPMQAYILIMAVMFIFVNLAVDVAYGFIDPRIRYD